MIETADGVFLRLLGPVRVEGMGTGAVSGPAQRRFRSRRTVALLGYLVGERRPVAREHLATFFWPDEDLTKGKTNLRRELYNLGKILPGCWQADTQTVRFVPDDTITVDIDLLRRMRRENRWQDAASLLSGIFLEGVDLKDNIDFETWLLTERERWRDLSQTILHNVAGEMIRSGRYNSGARYLRRALQLTPWDESAHRQLMRLLAWQGRREEALQQFTNCRRILREELDVEPAARTLALYQQIRDGTLVRPPQPPPFLIEAGERRQDTPGRFVLREQELAWLHGRLEEALACNGGVIFVTGSPGLGKTALIDTFAIQALAAHAELLVAKGNCAAYAGAGDPYLPFQEIMAMLGGDVAAQWTAGTISSAHARRLWNALPFVAEMIVRHGPGILDFLLPGQALLRRVQAAVPSGAAWIDRLQELLQQRLQSGDDGERSMLFAQFSRVLAAVAAERPLLLLLDDLQWMDKASAALLFHLARRLQGSRILILCTYRPEEIGGIQGEENPLASALGEFKRLFGEAWLNLAWADDAESGRFVDALLDREPNRLGPDFRASLLKRTRGHPLFTVELLRTLRERGALQQDGDGYLRQERAVDWRIMPARVEAVIEQRVRQLDPDLQQLLAVASVEGERFTAQVLARVLGIDEGALLRRLSAELHQRHQLVQEHEFYVSGGRPIARFGFSHALFQEYLYARLGHAERRLLHGSVAAALEAVYVDSHEALSASLAQHFRHAGQNEHALHYYTLAAGKAARVFAYDEVISHCSRAIELAGEVEAPQPVLANLLLRRGEAHAIRGHFNQALADLETALSLAAAAGRRNMQWRILLELGKLWLSQDYHRARDSLAAALDLAQQISDPALLARSLNRLGNWYANDENPGQALLYHQSALRIFEELNDRPNLANTLDLLGIVQLLSGNFAASATFYHRAIALFRDLGDDSRLVSSLMGRAVLTTSPAWLTLAPSYDPANPLADFEEGVRIARRIGSAPDEAWSKWPLALLSMIQGNYGRALAEGREGARLAAEIEHREWQVGALFALGILYNELLDPHQARRELEQGLALARDLRSQYWINHVTAVLVQSLLLLGELAQAHGYLETIITRLTPMDTTGKRYGWAMRAELALAVDHPDYALDIAERLSATAAGAGPGDIVTYLWLLRGRALLRLRRLAEAGELLRAGQEVAARRGHNFLLWRYHRALGRVHLAAGEDEAAAADRAAARLLVEEVAATVPGQVLAAGFRRRAVALLEADAGE